MLISYGLPPFHIFVFIQTSLNYLERLPKMVLRSEVVALSHARKLIALMYYASPELVDDHIFCSPMKAARFLDLFMLYFGHNSYFSGSIDKLISSKPLSDAELKASSLSSSVSHVINGDDLPLVSKLSMENPSENMLSEYEFRNMPPWFLNVTTTTTTSSLYPTTWGRLHESFFSIVSY